MNPDEDCGRTVAAGRGGEAGRNKGRKINALTKEESELLMRSMKWEPKCRLLPHSDWARNHQWRPGWAVCVACTHTCTHMCPHTRMTPPRACVFHTFLLSAASCHHWAGYVLTFSLNVSTWIQRPGPKSPDMFREMRRARLPTQKISCSSYSVGRWGGGCQGWWASSIRFISTLLYKPLNDPLLVRPKTIPWEAGVHAGESRSLSQDPG